MPPRVRNLFRNCFQRPAADESIETIWKINKKVRGEFQFVVPRKDFERFAIMKPENGAILTVGQYMFFYQYVISAGSCKEPGPDFERVLYYFWDNSSMFLLKGWVPTVKDIKKGYIPENTLISNLNRKVREFKPNDASPVYIKEKSKYADESKSPVVVCPPSIGSKVECESRMAPTEVFAGPPRVKSTYNWGVINTWSRHMAPESEDHDPVYIYDRFRQAALPSCSNISPLAKLDRDINNAIEGKSINNDHGPRQPKETKGMVASTLDTRDRRVRPGAAKGQRTCHILNYDNYTR